MAVVESQHACFPSKVLTWILGDVVDQGHSISRGPSASSRFFRVSEAPNSAFGWTLMFNPNMQGEPRCLAGGGCGFWPVQTIAPFTQELLVPALAVQTVSSTGSLSAPTVLGDGLQSVSAARSDSRLGPGMSSGGQSDCIGLIVGVPGVPFLLQMDKKVKIGFREIGVLLLQNQLHAEGVVMTEAM
ncbi:hypothetical protein NE237_032752 [Protea cynaroides]|uniref:Uncharacterized protein n=1 Tax=Protea cynaroides TaxID=273540 RepID=A0A9Q0R3V2_9MAGN|nr:hypothetical protein NE237_032752 [Protea cynaroides]